jgi:hypothetical protein
MMPPCWLLHPHQTSPSMGKRRLHSFGPIQSNPPAHSSPLKGEVGWGWGPEYGDIQ